MILPQCFSNATIPVKLFFVNLFFHPHYTYNKFQLSTSFSRRTIPKLLMSIEGIMTTKRIFFPHFEPFCASRNHVVPTSFLLWKDLATLLIFKQASHTFTIIAWNGQIYFKDQLHNAQATITRNVFEVNRDLL
jgi:hypothetical protein